jgi:RNase P protein component
MRPLLPDLAPGWDLILIARPALASSSLQEIRQALTSLLRRAKIIPLSNES